MSYAMKPLACDPTRLSGLSEKLVAMHSMNAAQAYGAAAGTA